MGEKQPVGVLALAIRVRGREFNPVLTSRGDGHIPGAAATANRDRDTRGGINGRPGVAGDAGPGSNGVAGCQVNAKNDGAAR